MQGRTAMFTARGVVLLLAITSIATPGSNPALVDAVRNKDRETAHALLQQHADVNAAQPDGTTALAWAAHWDDHEMAELLIHAGADVNAANQYGVSPLSLACTNGSAAMVERLLRAGANPNAALLRTQETVLMTCAGTGNAAAVRSLLARGADVNARETRRGQTALMWAVAEKHPQVVEVLIEYRADVHARSKGGIPAQYGSAKRETGFTPLLFAARVGDLDSAKLLLEAGADINESTQEDGNALAIAAASGHEKLALFLLDKGADPNSADAFGLAPLHYAVRKAVLELTGFEFYSERMPPPNMHELAKALLQRGASPNAQITTAFPSNTRYHEGAVMSLVGATPFLLAAHSADVPLMQFMLANGADPRLASKAGNTPLLLAAGLVRDARLITADANKNALEAVRLLVERGADVNEANVTGQTAMHAAASMGSNALIQFLVDNGAQVDVKSKSGETPWSVAEAMCPLAGSTNGCGTYVVHKDTAGLLLRLGASPVSPPPAEYGGSQVGVEPQQAIDAAKPDTAR